jgi:hypothetical protein
MAERESREGPSLGRGMGGLVAGALAAGQGEYFATGGGSSGSSSSSSSSRSSGSSSSDGSPGFPSNGRSPNGDNGNLYGGAGGLDDRVRLEDLPQDIAEKFTDPEIGEPLFDFEAQSYAEGNL